MSEIHEFLNYYSEVAENLEFMSNCMKRSRKPKTEAEVAILSEIAKGPQEIDFDGI